MRVIRSNPPQLRLGLIYGVIVVSILAVFRTIPDLPKVLPSCVFHRITGLPCPSCGMTRAMIALSHFRVLDALHLNPLIAAGLIGLMAWALLSMASVLTRVRWQIVPTPKELLNLRIVIISLIVLNWIYLIFS